MPAVTASTVSTTEATAAVGDGANSLRRIRERYREAYDEKLARWQTLRDDLERLEGEPQRRAGLDRRRRPAMADVSLAGARQRRSGSTSARTRVAAAQEVDRLVCELADHQAELARLELAQRTLERTWLFLERGDETLLAEADGPRRPTDIAMRIVEAQEAERSRLAQEVHDGPAQSLSNAIFQVEYIERVLDTRPAARRARSCATCASSSAASSATCARSSASSVRRSSTSSGLDGAIDDAVEHVRAVSGVTITTVLDGADRRPRRGGADGRAARRPGSPPECPQARLGDERGGSPPRWTTTGSSSRSATMVAASTARRWPPRAAATSACNSCASEPS